MFIFSDSSSQSNWNGWEESTMIAWQEVGKCFREFPWKMYLNIWDVRAERGERLLEKYFSKWKVVSEWKGSSKWELHSTQLIRFSTTNLQVKQWNESNNSSSST